VGAGNYLKQTKVALGGGRLVGPGRLLRGFEDYETLEKTR